MIFTPLKGHFRNGLSEGRGELAVQFAIFEKYLNLFNFDGKKFFCVVNKVTGEQRFGGCTVDI